MWNHLSLSVYVWEDVLQSYHLLSTCMNWFSLSDYREYILWNHNLGILCLEKFWISYSVSNPTNGNCVLSNYCNQFLLWEQFFQENHKLLTRIGSEDFVYSTCTKFFSTCTEVQYLQLHAVEFCVKICKSPSHLHKMRVKVTEQWSGITGRRDLGQTGQMEDKDKTVLV